MQQLSGSVGTLYLKQACIRFNDEKCVKPGRLTSECNGVLYHVWIVLFPRGTRDVTAKTPTRNKSSNHGSQSIRLSLLLAVKTAQPNQDPKNPLQPRFIRLRSLSLAPRTVSEPYWPPFHWSSYPEKPRSSESIFTILRVPPSPVGQERSKVSSIQIVFLPLLSLEARKTHFPNTRG